MSLTFAIATSIRPSLSKSPNAAPRPAFAMVALPKMLLPVALRHQHADYLNARRVQTLIHVHGSGGFDGDLPADAPQLVDLDALAAEEREKKESAQADVA